ncbi:MAG: hypothetical protein ACKO26_15695, partial [Planctomycetota bacterium]
MNSRAVSDSRGGARLSRDQATTPAYTSRTSSGPSSGYRPSNGLANSPKDFQSVPPLASGWPALARRRLGDTPQSLSHQSNTLPSQRSSSSRSLFPRAIRHSRKRASRVTRPTATATFSAGHIPETISRT